MVIGMSECLLGVVSPFCVGRAGFNMSSRTGAFSSSWNHLIPRCIPLVRYPWQRGASRDTNVINDCTESHAPWLFYSPCHSFWPTLFSSFHSLSLLSYSSFSSLSPLLPFFPFSQLLLSFPLYKSAITITPASSAWHNCWQSDSPAATFILALTIPPLSVSNSRLLEPYCTLLVWPTDTPV